MLKTKMRLTKLSVAAITSVLLLSSAFLVMAAENVLLDRVNIGDTSSEAGHNLVGWGPIEPTTHPGGWGGIGSETPPGTARVVWYSDLDGSQSSSWACTPDDSSPDPNSNHAVVTLNPKPGSAHNLKLRVLKGIGDDSFKVYVRHANGTLVEVYSFTDGVLWETETWIEHSINLDLFALARGKPQEIHIVATAPAWAGWCPYGQLGVDWIELWGNGKPR